MGTNKDKPWYNNAKLASVLQFLISIAVGGTISWIVSFHTSWFVLIPIILTAGLIGVQIFLICKAVKREDDRKAQIENMQDKYNSEHAQVQQLTHDLSAAQKSTDELGRIFYKTAEMLNEISHNIEATGHYQESLWNFQQACDDVCERLLRVVKAVSEKGDEFSVDYVSSEKALHGSIKKKANKAAVVMVGHSGDITERPSVFFPNAIPRKYHSRKLFAAKQHDISILPNPSEVETALVVRNGTDNKYSQYIGIPVFCENEKMIGLIEILAYRDSRIGDEEKSKLLNVAETFFRPYAHLFFLLNKIEKAMLTQPPPERKNNPEGVDG